MSNQTKTATEMALSSISWQLKRIADSLETIEDLINHPGNDEIVVKTYENPRVQQMIDDLRARQAQGEDAKINPRVNSDRLKQMLKNINKDK